MTATPQRIELARRVGMFDLTLLVMGAIIGTAIFMVPHVVAREVKSATLATLAWLLGGALSMAGALVYAELASRRPHAGGTYVYLRDAYHPAVAFLFGWTLLSVIKTGSMASVAVIFARYFLELTGWPVAPQVVTTLAIAAVSLVNCFGVHAGSRVQSIFMLAKIAVISALIGAGAWFAATHAPAASAPAALDPLSAATSFGGAMVVVMFTYGGYQMATFVSGEVKDPERTLPRGLILGVAGVTLLYLGVSTVCLWVLGAEQLGTTATPASAVMKLAFGETGGKLIAGGIAISALGFLSQATLTSPRVYFAMARDGLFFQAVARLHPATRVPVAAILLQGTLAILIALTGRYEQILHYVMSGEYFFGALAAWSVFRFRAREPGHQGFRTPGHPYTTLFFIAVFLAVAVNSFYKYPVDGLIGVGIVAAGYPVYRYWQSESGHSKAAAARR